MNANLKREVIAALLKAKRPDLANVVAQSKERVTAAIPKEAASILNFFAVAGQLHEPRDVHFLGKQANAYVYVFSGAGAKKALELLNQFRRELPGVDVRFSGNRAMVSLADVINPDLDKFMGKWRYSG